MRLMRERMVTKLVSMPPSHAATLSSVLHRFLSLLLGAHEEDLAGLRGVAQEGVGLVGVDDGLLEVEDVHTVALAEDVRLHLRVPTMGLVTKVAASLEQGTDRNLGSHDNLLWFASARGQPSPATRVCATGTRAPRRESSRACVIVLLPNRQRSA